MPNVDPTSAGKLAASSDRVVLRLATGIAPSAAPATAIAHRNCATGVAKPNNLAVASVLVTIVQRGVFCGSAAAVIPGTTAGAGG